MHRRSVLATAVAIPFAGCSALGFGDDAYLDDEIEAGTIYTFDADAGDVEITIEVADSGELENEDGEKIDAESSSIEIRYDGPPIFAKSVDEGSEETFEATFDEDGEYEILITSGTADVTIEPV